MQPDEQAEPPVAGSAAEPVLLNLPDELLRAVGQEAWSPLVPAASAALARACRRIASALRPLLQHELRPLLLTQQSGGLAAFGSLTVGPPWHLAFGRPVAHGASSIRPGRHGLQSYLRYLIVDGACRAEAIVDVLMREWRLLRPTGGVVRVVGGGTDLALPPPLKGAVVRGLAAVARERCWLVTDGITGRGSGGDGTAAALVGRARELIDRPGLRERGERRRRPVLLAFCPLEHVQCRAQLATNRGAQLVVDQSLVPPSDEGRAAR